MATPSPIAAFPPPRGVTPDFDTPVSLNKWNTVCVAVCLSITSTLFFLRCYVRLGIKREWVLEDYMCCSAWAFLVAFCTMNTVVMHKHGGVHIWDLTIPQLRQATYWFNVASIVYTPAILSTKLAILLLYRRVFSPHRRGSFDLTIRFFMLFLCLFYASTTIVKIWECTPRERIWNKSVPGTCINVPALLDASGICNTLTDLIILLMPIHAVWNLKTTTWRKIGVVIVFTVGFIAPAFSLVGVIVRFKTSKSKDTTWNQPTILLWGAAEASCGLICVCVPALAILAHRRRPQIPHLHHHHHTAVKSKDSAISSRWATLSSKSRYKHDQDSADEINLFDALDLELQHPGSKGIRAPAAAVVTGIVGGKESYDKEEGESSRDDGEDAGGEERGRVGGIVRTVRMEQTYL